MFGIINLTWTETTQLYFQRFTVMSYSLWTERIKLIGLCKTINIGLYETSAHLTFDLLFLMNITIVELEKFNSRNFISNQLVVYNPNTDLLKMCCTKMFTYSKLEL